MSHTSQRRGLSPDRPGREMIVLAMIPARCRDMEGIGSAMSELALKMLDHGPANWLSRNFTEITVPDLGPAQGPVEWMHRRWPETTQRLLMQGVGHLSSVVTALYTDRSRVVSLISDLKGDWLQRNRERGYPISIVLSGLFDDVDECCRMTHTSGHTWLHSLGFFGSVENLPGEVELEIMTMCGHGLIASGRVRKLVEGIKKGELTPEQAARDVAKPCVCGIVNEERAREAFEKLAGL